MAAITICSDFGAQINGQPLFLLFPHLSAMNDGTGCRDLSFLNVELSQHLKPTLDPECSVA